MNRILACTAIMILAGCAEPNVLSPTQLNSNPMLYNGMTVSVRGYVVLAPEGHNLRDSKEVFDEFARHFDPSLPRDPTFDVRNHENECLTIGNPGFLYDHIDVFKGKTIIFRGRFITDYLNDHVVDLGACPLPTALIIDIDDLKARYGREINP